MAVGDTVKQDDAVLTVRQFLDAFNDRDLDAMRGVVADDVELRLTDGRVFRGIDGVRELIDAARSDELRLIPLHRGMHAEERHRVGEAGDVYVEMRVRELVRYDDIERIADFSVRDGDVASFALRPLD